MTRSFWRKRMNIGILLLAIATAGIGLGASAAEVSSTTWSGLKAPLATPWTAEVSPTNALPQYPRPQLARPSLDHPQWMSLNGLWQFSATTSEARPPFDHAMKQRVLVPYPIESVLSGVQKHADHMVYRRQFQVPADFLKNKRHVWLNFGAVNYQATVYVNGQEVTRHEGGYTAFSADITAALKPEGPQEIAVAVYSPVDSAVIPVGKQRLKPSGIFYTAASGIWQSVWLEPVAPTRIATLVATPDVTHGSFHVSTGVSGDDAGATLSVDAYAGSERVAHAQGDAKKPLTLTLPKPHLWSPDDPFLYTFKAHLTSGTGTDTVQSYAGLRSIGVAKINGAQRIVLNGKPLFLLGTLDQGYWPDGIYTAPTDAALKFDIQKTRDLGFNTIRKHIKIEPARWYYWADKLGVMVWQDLPSMPTPKLSEVNKDTLRDEATAMVDQLKGATSIIGWVAFNEGWGQWSVPAAAQMGKHIKALDPTRLVDDRSGANCCDMPGDPHSGDIIDWHQYQGPAFPQPDATRAAIDGEHGGLTLTVAGHSWPSKAINPYGDTKNATDLTDKYVANTDALRDKGAAGDLSGSVYTQITDVEGEHNGLYTYDRRVEKIDEAKVRAVNRSVIKAAAKAASTPVK